MKRFFYSISGKFHDMHCTADSIRKIKFYSFAFFKVGQKKT